MPRDNKSSYYFHIDSIQQRFDALRTWLKKKEGWPTDSGMLWPIVATLTGFFMIQNVGQLRALGGALAAVMHRRDNYYDGGFAAGYIDLLTWWACCWVVVLASSTFTGRNQGGDPKGWAGKYRFITDGIAMHVVSCLLVLTPLFAAGLNLWQPEVLWSIATMALLTIWVSSLGRFYLMFFIVCMVASISADRHELFGLGALALGVWGLGLYFHPKRQLLKRSWLFQAGVSMVCGGVATFGLVFADSLLAWQNPREVSWDYRVLFLAAWWLLPALLVLIAKQVRSKFDDTKVNLAIIAAMFVGSVVVAQWPASVFALNSLCLLLAGLLAAGKIFRTYGLGFVGRSVLYAYLIAAVWKFGLLEPTPDFSKHDEPPAAYAVSRPSRFYEYYEQWLKARGETPRDHGPLILISVAGGGIRAAAHASIALSLADDATRGKFGERTLMVSAVSGGALGTATWLAKRVDGVPPADPLRIRSGGASPGGLALSRFYRNDFLSPVVNRMLFHDIPFAALPGLHGKSDRDVLLLQKWETSWDALLHENGIRPKAGSFFQRQMADLSADGNLPLVVFNATSAADGRSATYSSYPGAVRWSWELDSQATVGRAALDSARFAGISPVGVACAHDGAFDIPRMPESAVKCKPGFRPLAVADGGYRDNAGLAEIAVVVDELARSGDPLDQVFVVQISSNPDEGIKWVEGTRFSSGKLLPELIAPAIVQESARSGHPEAYVQQIQGRRNQPHMYTWGLPHNLEASTFASQHRQNRWIFNWLNERAVQAEWQQHARLPPLGWTMDPESYWALYRDSLRIRELPVVVPCGQLMPQYAVLCKALENANSVRRGR